MKKVSQPIITGALALEWLEKSKTPKPTARGTALRYSSTYSCARQQGYSSFGAEQTEPMDEAGAWVTGLGTLVHEAIQEAISRRFPSAQFEVSSQIGPVSGSCDALISVDDVGSSYGGTHVLWELKTMGTYSFDKQVGWSRLRGMWAKNPAEGPARKAIVQAGMNALGIEGENPDIRIETIIMGSAGFEALSKNKAENMNIEGLDRFLAEFDIPRDEWEPMAQAELRRMKDIHEETEEGYLPNRIALDDDGNVIRLSPTGSFWQCDYCAYRSVCLEDGGGSVYINESSLTRKEVQ